MDMTALDTHAAQKARINEAAKIIVTIANVGQASIKFAETNRCKVRNLKKLQKR